MNHYIYHSLLVVWTDNVFILHHFWDITTFSSVYVTVCDLEKSFTFHKTVETRKHAVDRTDMQTHAGNSRR